MELGLALLDQNSIMQVDNNVKAVHNLVARLLLKDLSGLLPLVRFSRSLVDSHHPGAEEGPLLHVCPHQGGGHHGGDAAPQDIHDLHHQVSQLSQSSGSLS